MKSICIVIIVMVLSSCNLKQSQQDEKPLTLKEGKLGIDSINKVIKLPNQLEGEINLTEMIDSIHYVSLETTDESLIGEISRIEFFDGKYYVLDSNYAKGLFIFDAKGNFLFAIQNIGGGPGEYKNLDDFCIDYIRNEIILHSSMPRKIMRYDLNGNHIKDYPFLFYTNSLAFLPEVNHYVFCNGYRQNNFTQEYNLMETDTLFNIGKGYFPYDSKKMAEYPCPQNYFYNYNKRFYFVDDLSGITYSLYPDSINLHYKFDFGNRTFDKKRLYTSRESVDEYVKSKKILQILNIQENDSFIFLSISGHQMIYNGYYCKSTGNIKIGDSVTSDISALSSILSIGSYKDKFISAITSERISSIKEKMASSMDAKGGNIKMHLELKTIFEKTIEGDNPTLAIFSLKKF